MISLSLSLYYRYTLFVASTELRFSPIGDKIHKVKLN